MEGLGKLALALAKAQGQIKDALKDSVNPYFKSNYADLSSVWNACRKPLTDNELAVVQKTIFKDGHWILVTSLIHSSGEFIDGEVPLLLKDQDMQKFKAAVTYARRIGLGAMVGVCDIDDDGESVAMRDSREPITNPHYEPAQGQWHPSEAQVKRLFAIAKKNGYSVDNFEPLKNLMATKFDKVNSSDLDKPEYEGICAHMEQNKWNQAEHEKFPFEEDGKLGF